MLIMCSNSNRDKLLFLTVDGDVLFFLTRRNGKDVIAWTSQLKIEPLDIQSLACHDISKCLITYYLHRAAMNT